MAEFLTTTSFVSKLEHIIKSAQRRIILVTPYLKVSRNFEERLRDADSRNVPITLIYGKEEEKPADQLDMLTELQNIKIHFLDNLHAKCYTNESMMIIGSMNLHEYSELHNREMGLFLDKTVDRTLFEEAMKEIESIKSASRMKYQRRGNFRLVNPDNGFCIRCGKAKDFSPGNPYCKECYFSWREFNNREYIEQICHSCGQPAQTTIDKPMCYECFIQWNHF